MDTKKKILTTVTNYGEICKAGKSLLEKNGFEILENPYGRPMTYDELKEIIGDIYGVVAGVDTWNEDIFHLARNLRVIARFGVGVDNIDIVRAKERGIIVTNCLGANSNSVSEQAIALILSSVRMIPRLMATTKENKWERVVFHELSSLTIGFLGFGAIARMTAEKLTSFGAKLIAFDINPNYEEARRLGVIMVSKDELWKQSDILSIHIPGLPSTHHMINETVIQNLKDGVHIINTSRGSVIDEDALYCGLKSGKIGGAAIDVYEVEPVHSDNPLFTLPNFIGTPHTAAESYENYHRCGILTAEAILDVYQGKIPKNMIN